MDLLSTIDTAPSSVPPPRLTPKQKGVVLPIALQLKTRLIADAGQHVRCWHPPSAIAARFGLPLQVGSLLNYSGTIRNDLASTLLLDIDPTSDRFGLPRASPGVDPRDAFYGDAVIVRTDGRDIRSYGEVQALVDYIQREVMPLLKQYREGVRDVVSPSLREEWVKLCRKRMSRRDMRNWVRGREWYVKYDVMK